MTKAKTACLVIFLLCTFVTVIMYIPVWLDDAEARSNKEKVRSFISVGQDLSEAEILLRDQDFKLVYEKPIAPTYDQSYLQQLVVVGNTQPNFFEAIAY